MPLDESDMKVIVELMRQVEGAINENRSMIRGCLSALEQLRSQLGELEDELGKLARRS